MAKKSKSKTPQEQMNEAVAELVERHNRWQNLYENGGSDPSWSDGVNLNLVRNHIRFAKRFLLWKKMKTTNIFFR